MTTAHTPLVMTGRGPVRVHELLSSDVVRTERGYTPVSRITPLDVAWISSRQSVDTESIIQHVAALQRADALEAVTRRCDHELVLLEIRRRMVKAGVTEGQAGQLLSFAYQRGHTYGYSGVESIADELASALEAGR